MKGISMTKPLKHLDWEYYFEKRAPWFRQSSMHINLSGMLAKCFLEGMLAGRVRQVSWYKMRKQAKNPVKKAKTPSWIFLRLHLAVKFRFLWCLMKKHINALLQQIFYDLPPALSRLNAAINLAKFSSWPTKFQNPKKRQDRVENDKAMHLLETKGKISWYLKKSALYIQVKKKISAACKL